MDAECVAENGARGKAFCFLKSTGLCGGECDGGRGNAWCKQKYGNATDTRRPLCVDDVGSGRGAWCVQCSTSILPPKGAKPIAEHSAACDPGMPVVKHSDKPFCLSDTGMCASCDAVYGATGKCPNSDPDSSHYGTICVMDGNRCLDFATAPCSAFKGSFCPTNNKRCVQKGGKCK